MPEPKRYKKTRPQLPESNSTEFFNQYGESIVNSVENTGLFASLKAAQMALETGFGRRVVGNNFFGVKAGKGDKQVLSNTKEFVNGKSGTYLQNFKAYDSADQSINDHTSFLQKNERYKRAGVYDAKTPEEQAMALQRAGYATDPRYAEKLISIMNKHGLKKYDKQKPIVQTITPAIADNTFIAQPTTIQSPVVQVPKPQEIRIGSAPIVAAPQRKAPRLSSLLSMLEEDNVGNEDYLNSLYGT